MNVIIFICNILKHIINYNKIKKMKNKTSNFYVTIN